MEKDNNNQLLKIKHFVLDVDGVMTDGTVGCLANGEMYRTFSVRDGYAMERAVTAGYRLCVITGGNQESVRQRLEYLKIKDIFMGSRTKNKIEIFEEYLSTNHINPHEVVYMGDDMPDLEVMSNKKILSVAPADAIDEILQVADMVCQKKGGHGAVREIIEKVMKVQGTW